jgi:asparagine synthetase B (glutamine-hydrolysing)
MMRYSSFKKKRNYVRYCKNKLKAPSTSNETRVNWYQFRKNYLEGDCAGLEQHTRLANSFDKIHVTPYLDERVYDILMRMSWQELNKPKQKYIIREEFDLHTLKPHLNLHLGSGVNKLFEKLLKDDTINFNGRKRMMDVARDHYQKQSDLS